MADFSREKLTEIPSAITTATHIQEKLSEFFPTIGLTGKVTVEPSDMPDEYTITVASRFIPFTGFFPEKTENTFTITLTSKTKTLHGGIDVEYIEAILFTADTLQPKAFVIFQYPQSQTIYLADYDGYKKGNIVYCDLCEELVSKTIEKPVFQSRIVDVSKMFE